MVRITLVASVAIVALTTSAEAGVFTSSSAFFAATTATTTEDYGTTTAGELVPSGSTLDGLTYTFSTTGGMGGVITNLYNSFTGLSLAAKQVSGPLSSSDFFFGGNSFTVTFPSPVTAVGIFANVNLNSGTYTLSTSSGSGTTGSAAFDTDTFVFVGLTSSVPFSSATFVSNNTSLGSYNIPEIAYGTGRSIPGGGITRAFGRRDYRPRFGTSPRLTRSAKLASQIKVRATPRTVRGVRVESCDDS